MSYLNFDKTLLVNLDRSLSKEMIHTNRAGAYMSSSLVDCNTRKYHGLLVLPLPQVGDSNYVLLSSLDETVVQYGAEFNLGVHQYGEHTFSPNGHRYIREYDCTTLSKTTYRVGGVVLTKERLLVSFEPRVLLRYTLLEAGSPVQMRFRPFLAFRDVNSLTHANSNASTDMDEVANGRVNCMYNGFPPLYMQFSKKVEYEHNPQWYNNICYRKEEERGFDYQEDLLVPGAFILTMKEGESVVFSAGITEVQPRTLRTVWDKEVYRRIVREDMFSCLKNSASQFYKRIGDKCWLLSGYPWFKTVARDEFFALCDCTMGIGRPEYWDAIMNKTAVNEVRAFLEGRMEEIGLIGMDEPDVLLWFVRCIQEYANYTDINAVAQQYGQLVIDTVQYIRQQKHPRLFLHRNGLVWVDGINRPATWMNAVEDGRPITPRTGYVVEINALWYNAMRFAAEMLRTLGNEHRADLMEYQAELTRDSFVAVFWNGNYLNDYVVDDYKDREVRPNQIWAVALPYSPLDKKQQKAVVDICTKELYTPKGLRTLSPKSGNYRPVYIGGQKERDRNFHNGPVWPLTIAAYGRAYLRVYQHSGESFIRRLLTGYEAEMNQLTIGTINELYDGNPPFKGHGGMSYAPSISGVLGLYNCLPKE
ncbi:MAG: glycogen debranching enzyme family protein [Paludibacteraceae bacterium]|nr:glycogen debranching enzyme family protein [Paludibacteraceae bacterium]